jgi:UDP-glucose 4-epimerase
MEMPSIAVTGVSGLVGQALVARLAQESSVTRIVGLDVREPRRRTRALEFHLIDVARAELKPVLEGTDVLVHLASVVDPIPDEAIMARVNVEGTRRVLDAAGAVDVGKVVRVSSAAVYGAWPNNAVPLTEAATLRPNPGFSPAVQAAEVERLLAEWRADHPAATVTTLRSAPVLGPGAERLPSRLLMGRPALRVRGASPPVQAVHVDDLVEALVLVVMEDHPGVYNVAADGWLAHRDARDLLPRSMLPALPGELLERVLRRTWATGMGEIPPGVVPYLVNPWVIANDALRELGWVPLHSNEKAIRDGLASLPAPRSRARLVTFAFGVAVGGALAGAAFRRRRGRRGPARRP